MCAKFDNFNKGHFFARISRLSLKPKKQLIKNKERVPEKDKSTRKVGNAKTQLSMATVYNPK